MMRTYSLRLRILFGILAAVALVWSVVGVIAYREARHEADHRIVNAEIEETVASLVSLLGLACDPLSKDDIEYSA